MTSMCEFKSDSKLYEMINVSGDLMETKVVIKQEIEDTKSFISFNENFTTVKVEMNDEQAYVNSDLISLKEVDKQEVFDMKSYIPFNCGNLKVEDVKSNVLFNNKFHVNNINSNSICDYQKIIHQCRICSVSFDTIEMHFQHIITDHNKLSIKQCKSNKCEIHLKNHNVENMYICGYCCRGFKSKCSLKTHVKVHLNKREYKCKICWKQFNTSVILYSHNLKVHTDKTLWKYVCAKCGKRFPAKTNFVRHTLIHGENRPYSCDICDKTFKQVGNCKRHMRTHSGEYLYNCDLCKKEYRTKTSLKDHMVRMHDLGSPSYRQRRKESRKYPCDLCTKSYFRKDHLRDHMFMHTGEKPYSCYVCSKKFGYKAALRHHLKRVHKVLNKQDY